MPRVAVALILQFLTRPADLGEDPARMFEQARAGVREHDAAAVAFEQILAEFRLQLTHLAAERRLGHREKGAARVKLPNSATWRKYSSCFRSIRRAAPSHTDSAITDMLLIP